MHPTWLRRSILLSLAVAPVAMAQQYTWQHTNQIPLSSLFNFGDSANGIPASAYGTNPLSIAYDGTSLYVGGHSGASGTVGVARIDNPLTTTTTLVGLPSSQFAAASGRGIDAMSAKDTVGIFLAHDSGSAGTSLIRKIDSSGNTIWTTLNPSNVRVNAMAVDPKSDAGNPCVSFLSISGSGRLQALSASTGSLILAASNAIYSGPEPKGEIIVGDGDTGNNQFRGLAFDSAGNIALQERNYVGYGVRDLTLGPTRIKSLAGVASSTSKVEKKALLDGTRANNIGSGVAILEGVGGNDLLVSSARLGGTATLGYNSSYVDYAGGTNNYTSKNILIRNKDGTVNPAVQSAIAGGEDGIGTPFTEEIRNFAVGRDANSNPVLFSVSYVENRVDIYSLEPTYTGTGDGSWNDSGSWLGGVVPNSGLQNARFGGSISGASDITLNDARTTKNLKFDSAQSYSISGTGTLTLDAPDAWGAQIQVLNGSHSIDVPITLNKSANFTVTNAADVLQINGEISAAGKGVTKRGAGTAIVKALRLSALSVQGGTLTFGLNGTANGTGKTGSLVISGATDAWTSTLDIKNNAIAVDYTGTSPLADIQNQVKSGYASGAWTGTGIRSSIAALSAIPTKGAIAVAENSELLAAPDIFNQVTTDADTVLVMYTLAGDATMDRKVDTLDFNMLAGNFGTGSKWTQGDSNYDGAVDSQDFNALVGNFGATVPLTAPNLGSTVPEPASLGALSMALSALALRRRK